MRKLTNQELSILGSFPDSGDFNSRYFPKDVLRGLKRLKLIKPGQRKVIYKTRKRKRPWYFDGRGKKRWGKLRPLPPRDEYLQLTPLGRRLSRELKALAVVNEGIGHLREAVRQLNKLNRMKSIKGRP
jgi:hypothetical protein